ncbi:hypothetical protein [Phormidium sp. FACHB-1136]|uniref:hypothetical protein n=1 Tax=Phormidium sp. FACHB-1136 TaxID=2692848 RepID=UPI00168702E2|nr:hypothetical protein [Phormidium sp. FACHB-1136]MBD2426089.1 hypothetical protein [Phormidium sp. FACHB-1136]
MKLLLFLLATGALVFWVGLAPAQAEDFILSFDPPALPKPPPPPEPALETTLPPVAPEHRPLPIPAHGTRPPMRFHSPSQLPAGVNRQAVAVALDQGHRAADVLPPVPPRLPPDPAVVAAPAPDAPPPDPVAAISPEPEPKTDDVIVSFRLDSTADTVATVARSEVAPPPATAPPAPVLSTLFEGGSQSLVARTVGSAEGTRTAKGDITTAYYGHTDPGNRAWNLGTFSYQHGAASAEEADRKQLQRLQSQTEVLERRALNRGMTLTLEETLNGIDLANQSPLAAIGRVGYIERLAEVKTWGLEGTEAIVVARTRSYINPNTGRWNAPGLGNTEASITRDQRRRTDAIARALEAYRQEHPTFHLSPTLVTIAPPDVLAAAPPPEPLPEPEPAPDTLPVRFSLDEEQPLNAVAATLTPVVAEAAEANRTDPAPINSELTVPELPNPESPNPESPNPEQPGTEPPDTELSEAESPSAGRSDTGPSNAERPAAESPDSKPSDAWASDPEPSDAESSNSELPDPPKSDPEAPTPAGDGENRAEPESPAALTH